MTRTRKILIALAIFLGGSILLILGIFYGMATRQITIEISLATPTPFATPTLTPTSAPSLPQSLIIGKRTVASNEVERAFPSEPIKFIEHQILVQNYTVTYYDVYFEKLNRSARMVGTIPVSMMNSNGLAPSIAIRGFVASYGNSPVMKLPLLYPATVDNVSVIPVVYLVDGGDDLFFSDWRIGLYQEDTGQLLQSEQAFVTASDQTQLHLDYAWNALQQQFVICAHDCVLDYSGTMGAVVLPGTRTPTPTHEPMAARLPTQTPTPTPTSLPTRTPIPAPTLNGTVYENIPLYGFSPEDAQYVKDSLEWLKQAAPNWWNYILAQRPFWIKFDSRQGNVPAGQAGCCDTHGFGYITIFAPALKYKDGTQLPKAGFEFERSWFIGLLVHEATHIPQNRTGKATGYTYSKDNSICIEIEHEAFDTQTAALRDLAHVVVGDHSTQGQYEWYMNRVIEGGFGDTLSDAQNDCEWASQNLNK